MKTILDTLTAKVSGSLGVQKDVADLEAAALAATNTDLQPAVESLRALSEQTREISVRINRVKQGIEARVSNIRDAA